MGGGVVSEVKWSIWSEKPLNRQRSRTPSWTVKIPVGVYFCMNRAVLNASCSVNVLPWYNDDNVKASALSILWGRMWLGLETSGCPSWLGWRDATGV